MESSRNSLFGYYSDQQNHWGDGENDAGTESIRNEEREAMMLSEEVRQMGDGF